MLTVKLWEIFSKIFKMLASSFGKGLGRDFEEIVEWMDWLDLFEILIESDLLKLLDLDKVRVRCSEVSVRPG